jgi:hypothetical protein
MGRRVSRSVTLEHSKICADAFWDKTYKALPQVDVEVIFQAMDQCNKVDAEILKVEWRDRKEELVNYLINRCVR